MDPEIWEYTEYKEPLQTNDFDCAGVFACCFVPFVLQGREIDFTQSHMNYFRLWISSKVVAALK